MKKSRFMAVQPKIAFNASQRQVRRAVACRRWYKCALRFYTCAQAIDFGSLSADFARWGQSHGRVKRLLV